jgi:hypothetical protein
LDVIDKGVWVFNGMFIPKAEDLRDLYTKSWKEMKNPKNYVPLGIFNGLGLLCVDTNDDNMYYISNRVPTKIRKIVSVSKLSRNE